MSTEIAYLNIRLPGGFEARASRIARLVGEGLATRLAGQGGSRQRIERLGVAPVAIDPGRSDRAIAAQIAQSIHSALLAGGR